MSYIEKIFGKSFYAARRFFAPNLSDQISKLGLEKTKSKRHAIFMTLLAGREYSVNFSPLPEIVLVDQVVTLPQKLLLQQNADRCIRYVLIQITTFLKDSASKSILQLNQESLLQYPASIELIDALSSDERAYCDKLLSDLKIQSNAFDAKETANSFSSNKQNSKNTASAQSSPKLRTIDLSSSPDNPMVHMFEKVQTAEDYQGGNRSVEDAENLSEDQSALNEVLFSTVVRTNQTSSGLLETEASWGGLGQEKDRNVLDQDTTVLIREWFHKQNRYVDGWCQVFIAKDMQIPSALVEPSLDVKLLLKSLREKLEYIFNKNALLKRQRLGEDFDLDSLIRSLVDYRITHYFDDRIFLHRKRMERDVGVLFLIDTSMSTEAWIKDESGIDLLRKIIWIIAGALEGVLDHVQMDRFFSYTRKQCHYRHIKKFHDPWNNVRQIAPNIAPEGYTRMGPAIRQASNEFSKQSFRKKIIFVLSDCKPTDYDAYEGSHGNTDVRRAVLEAAANGVITHAFALTSGYNGNAEKMFDKNRVSFVSTATEFSEELFEILRTLFRGR